MLYKGKWKGTKCGKYRDISLLSVVGKIYVGLVVHRVSRVTDGLTENGQGRFHIKELGCGSNLK